MNRVVKILTLIANAHPERVRLLFEKYGIKADPTPKALGLALVAYGDPFRKDLSRVLAANFVGPGADGTEIDPVAGDSASSGWDNFLQFLSGAGDDLDTVSSLWDKIGGLFGGNQQQAQSQLEIERLQYQQDQLAAQNRMLIFGVVGLAVFTIVVLFVMRKK